jgi:hypothetical protein
MIILPHILIFDFCISFFIFANRSIICRLSISWPASDKETQNAIASCNSLGSFHARGDYMILIFVDRDVNALETNCSSREGDRIPVRSWLAINKQSKAVIMGDPRLERL